VNSSATPDDYSAANEGQLKQFTLEATREMNGHLPGGAGTSLNTLVTGWITEYGTAGYSGTNPMPSDFQVMTAGQLKYIGSLVWPQLEAESFVSRVPPWLSDTTGNTQAANLGQIKTVFNFDLTGTDTIQDTNSDGIPDWWENYYLGTIDINVEETSPSGDGDTILSEFESGWNPYDYYHTQLPQLTKESGDMQSGTCGHFVSEPLVVKATGTAGNTLYYAPITFYVVTGGGLIGTSTTATLSSSLSVRTGTDGLAQVYFQEPSANGSSQIMAIATTDISTGTNAATTSTNVIFNETTSTPIPRWDLTLWLRADVGATTLSSGTWADQSGNGNNATQSTAAYRPTLVPNALNGEPVVNFIAANPDYLQLGNIFTSATCGEVFVVLSASSGGPWGLWKLGTYNDPNGGALYPDSSGNLVGDFGSAEIYNEGPPSQDITKFHVYENSSQQGLWQSWIDGVPLFESGSNDFFLSNALETGTNNIVNFPSSPYSSYIGANYGTSAPRFNGNIAEIIIYSRILSGAERKSIIGYLDQKYGIGSAPVAPTGLQANALNANEAMVTWTVSCTGSETDYQVWRSGGSGNWTQVGTVANGGTYLDSGLSPTGSYSYKILAVNGAGTSGSFSSIATLNSNLSSVESFPTSGMQLWLMADGAWESPVGNWHDYSGQGNDAWQYISSKPTVVANAINGRPALHFDSEYLYLPNFISSATAGEVFVVLSASNSGDSGLWKFGTYGGDTSGGALYPNSSGELVGDFGSDGAVYDSGQPSQDVTQLHVYENSSQEGLWQSWIDGTLLFQSGTTGNTVAFTDQPVIGADEGTGAPYFNGNISEIIIYNRALSDPERKAVLQYLAIKYLLPSFDVDGDELTIGEDETLGLNPLNPDTNGDGLVNGLDITLGINPTNLYLVGNGETNAQNIALGIDLFSPYVPPPSPPPDSYPTVAPIITLLSPPDAVLVP
jgi:hypothetical protein